MISRTIKPGYISDLQLFSLESFHRTTEARGEVTQDDARTGFNNLTQSRDVLFDQSSGAKLINARGGDDTILTGAGDDTVHGGSGNDNITTQGGRDTITGGSGDDTIAAGAQDDTVHGGSGIDNIMGEEGDDVLNGGTGEDTIFGGADDDTINGGLDNDTLVGDGDNSLGGRDTLNGGFGEDILVGNSGADQLTGGDHADMFVYQIGLGSFNDSALNARDSILDFSRLDGDKIDLGAMDWSSAAGDQDFSFVDGPSGQAGVVWVEGTGADRVVMVNVNGGGADMAINVHLVDANATLSGFDFVL